MADSNVYIYKNNNGLFGLRQREVATPGDLYTDILEAHKRLQQVANPNQSETQNSENFNEENVVTHRINPNHEAMYKQEQQFWDDDFIKFGEIITKLKNNPNLPDLSEEDRQTIKKVKDFIEEKNNRIFWDNTSVVVTNTLIVVTLIALTLMFVYVAVAFAAGWFFCNASNGGCGNCLASSRFDNGYQNAVHDLVNDLNILEKYLDGENIVPSDEVEDDGMALNA